MRYPAKVFIQGNTQKPSRSLVFNNGLADVNGRQRTNKPSLKPGQALNQIGVQESCGRPFFIYFYLFIHIFI